MLFKRACRLTSSKNREEIKNNLVGEKVDIHGLFFEIVDKENMLKIIPHAEDDEKSRILPITHLEMSGSGSGTQIKLTSKPRKIDIGGPYMLLIFCAFIVVVGLFLYLTKGESMMLTAISMIGVGILVFALFMLRMQSGYFDYVRKIRRFVQSKI